MEIKIKKLKKDAVIPTKGSPFVAGSDLYSVEDDVKVGAGETVMIGTGLAMEIPEGYAGLIYARSGLACKEGLAPANKVGVVDSDYRGEIGVGLVNLGGEAYTVQPADRIAQLMVTPVVQPTVVPADTLDETDRGTGGFGSTGR